MDDPFKPPPDTQQVLASYCYVCRALDGCMVLVNKRFTIFHDTCGECSRKDKPDCHVRQSIRLVEIPTLCCTCAKSTS